MTTWLSRLVEINPPVPEFSEDPGAEVTFIPLECVWPDGKADVSRRAIASSVASGYTLFRDGDVLLPKITPTFEAGRVFAVSMGTPIGAGTTELHVLRPRQGVDGRFIAYVCRSQPFLQDGTTRLQGVGNLRRVPTEFLAKFPVVVTDPRDQCSIADYLDRETAQIDTLIEEQQRLIELQLERRQAAISHAIARGLGSERCLKESGQVGIGLIPTSWTVLPLRHAISYREGPGILAQDFRDQGVPLLRVSCVRGAEVTLDGCNFLDPEMVAKKWSHFRVAMGDLLISASASMGTVSEVRDADVVGAVPYTGIIQITPGAMRKNFARWFLVSGPFLEQIEALKTGSTIQHYGPTHLSQMRVALPPTDEQDRIACYLDEQTAKIDQLIAESERLIELASERRAALITAAVTGQIDVRGEVA